MHSHGAPHVTAASEGGAVGDTVETITRCTDVDAGVVVTTTRCTGVGAGVMVPGTGTSRDDGIISALMALLVIQRMRIIPKTIPKRLARR